MRVRAIAKGMRTSLARYNTATEPATITKSASPELSVARRETAISAALTDRKWQIFSVLTPGGHYTRRQVQCAQQGSLSH